jgi:hypothetical protein
MENDMLIDGLIFGLLDNGVLIIGAYTGCDIGERLGKGRGRLGAILGAGIGNLVSDAIGAACDPAMQHMVGGVALGCLLPLFLIPLVERLRRAKPHVHALTSSAVGFTHSDGEVICVDCHKDLGMDQVAECTPATSLQDLSSWECAGTCGRVYYPQLSMQAGLPQHPELTYARGWYRDGRLEDRLREVQS